MQSDDPMQQGEICQADHGCLSIVLTNDLRSEGCDAVYEVRSRRTGTGSRCYICHIAVHMQLIRAWLHIRVLRRAMDDAGVDGVALEGHATHGHDPAMAVKDKVAGDNTFEVRVSNSIDPYLRTRPKLKLQLRCCG